MPIKISISKINRGGRKRLSRYANVKIVDTSASKTKKRKLKR